MTLLRDYNHFDGRHWETGSIANALAYRGLQNPYTQAPYSEALLLGISGGAAMGYFNFTYQGYDPQARILTRNTFDPWDTLLSRLGIVQNVQHTGSPARGVRNLVEALEEGHAPVIWADIFSLPYNALPADEGMWAMMPHVVFGYDEAASQVQLADRASVALSVATETLQVARARVKKDNFRVVTFDPPITDKVASAVELGIWDCIKLYTEAPPKGSKNNFGLRAYEWWAEQLTNPRARMSWEKQFPAGRKMLAGLASAYDDIIHFGKHDDPADRGRFADFLDEASTILRRPALAEVSLFFHEACFAWHALAQALLPDDIEPFAHYRTLTDRSYIAFFAEGSGSTEERLEIASQLQAILTAMETDFPLDAAAVQAMRENIAEHVMAVHEIEAAGLAALEEAMTG